MSARDRRINFTAWRPNVDPVALTRLPDTIVGRVAYQVLAGLIGYPGASSRPDPAPLSAEELYRGAPYGVGYFAGVWLP